MKSEGTKHTVPDRPCLFSFSIFKTKIQWNINAKKLIGFDARHVFYYACCCVIALRIGKTVMVMSGRSVKIIILFVGRLRSPKRLTRTKRPYSRQ